MAHVVVPVPNDGWAVIREPLSLESVHTSRDRALEHARELASKDGEEVTSSYSEAWMLLAERLVSGSRKYDDSKGWSA